MIQWIEFLDYHLLAQLLCICMGQRWFLSETYHTQVKGRKVACRWIQETEISRSVLTTGVLCSASGTGSWSRAGRGCGRGQSIGCGDKHGMAQGGMPQ